MPYSQTSAFVFENKEALNYLGICDVVGECVRTDVCLHVNASHVFFVGMSYFSSSSSPSFLGVCVHMHHVIFFFLIIFKGKSLSSVHVCLCAQACVPRIFLGEGAFGGCMCMHARMTCTYCMDVCTLVEQLCCIQLLHTRAHAEQVLRGRLTFPFLGSFFFFIFIWCRLLLDLFIHEVLHVYSLFSMVLLSFLQLQTKIRASHYLVNIMEEVQFVSSNIEKAFEQCSCM